MANRVTGMYSGLDTESLIQDLIRAKSKKVEKLNKDKTKMEWKQEAWKGLNTKIKNFYAKSVSNMRWSTSYMKKTTSVSNTNAVSVITGDKAMNSVQSLSIKKLASSGYLTGAQVETTSGEKAKASDLVSSLKFGEGSFAGTGSFDVTVNGKNTTINIDESTTIDSVVNQLNAAGVNANFDEKNQRLFIGATDSGKQYDFTITANNAAGSSALSVLGINAAPSDAAKAAYSSIAALSSYIGANDAETVANIQAAGVDTDAYKRLMSFAKANYQKEVNAQAELVNAKKTAISEKQARIDELEKQDQSAFTAEDKEAYDAELAAAKADLETLNGELEPLNKKLEEMNTNLSAGTYSTEAMEKAAASLKEQVEFAATAGSADASTYNTGAVRLYGDDAVIELNGTTFTSNSNNVEVNGLTFTCKAVADNITVTTQNDTEGIYDMVKSFIKDYNELINEMDKLYNAASTKIEPLSDEERDAVSDSEAEKLEKQVRDALLRKDENLNDVFSALKDVMAGGFEVGGKTMYLSDFGINTLGYFNAPDGEKNAFHIDGDPDDENSSGNADKLKGMIASDPETVVSFFTGLTNKMYSKLTELSGTSEYSSFGSFYDDKTMKSDLSSFASKIAEAEERLTKEEDKLYDKFSAMEVALSKMQSKTSNLSALFS